MAVVGAAGGVGQILTAKLLEVRAGVFRRLVAPLLPLAMVSKHSSRWQLFLPDSEGTRSGRWCATRRRQRRSLEARATKTWRYIIFDHPDADRDVSQWSNTVIKILAGASCYTVPR